MIKFLVIIATFLMFPIAIFSAGFDVAKAFIEFHIVPLEKD